MNHTQLHSTVTHASSLCQSDADRYLAKAADIQVQLEDTARSHGFQSYVQMQRRMAYDRATLSDEAKYELLKKLAPIAEEVGLESRRPGLPSVDATGLVAIAELQRSVARLIRVLLVGYTDDEMQELADRMKAERAEDVNGMESQQRDANHNAALDRLTALLRPGAKVSP